MHKISPLFLCIFRGLFTIGHVPPPHVSRAPALPLLFPLSAFYGPLHGFSGLDHAAIAPGPRVGYVAFWCVWRGWFIHAPGCVVTWAWSSFLKSERPFTFFGAADGPVSALPAMPCRSLPPGDLGPLWAVLGRLGKEFAFYTKYELSPDMISTRAAAFRNIPGDTPPGLPFLIHPDACISSPDRIGPGPPAGYFGP